MKDRGTQARWRCAQAGRDELGGLQNARKAQRSPLACPHLQHVQQSTSPQHKQEALNSVPPPSPPSCRCRAPPAAPAPSCLPPASLSPASQSAQPLPPAAGRRSQGMGARAALQGRCAVAEATTGAAVCRNPLGRCLQRRHSGSSGAADAAPPPRPPAACVTTPIQRPAISPPRPALPACPPSAAAAPPLCASPAAPARTWVTGKAAEGAGWRSAVQRCCAFQERQTLHRVARRLRRGVNGQGATRIDR